MFILLSAVILVACTTTKYVPVESVKVDSVYVAKAQRDSIFERDSVYVAVKADTVFFSRVQYRYRDRILRDTVCVLSIDTISKIVEVEKRLTFWQHKKMLFGTVAMWLLPLLVGVFLFRKL